VSTSFASLGANEVNTNPKGFLDVLRVAHHIHYENTGLVQLVDGPFGRNANGANEEFRFLFNNDINKFR
jgi:hypothetical protein